MKLQEIARLAGVSTATVSRAFSRNINVREEVRNHIFEIAEKHGYHPRLSAKMRNVAVIVPYKSDYPVQSYAEMMLTELFHELPNHNFRIEIIPQDNLEQLSRIQFCAAVGICIEPELFLDWDRSFAAPLIMVNRTLPAPKKGIYSVCSDDEQGMELAVSHLVRSGCRKIGSIVYGVKHKGNTDSYCRNIQKALKNNHLPCSAELVKVAMEENFVEEVGKMLKSGIDALFCPGGKGGFLAIYALNLYNRRIPEDISLIASERTTISRFSLPPQTTITPDYNLLAQEIVKVLNSIMDSKPAPQVIRLPFKLIERDSVKQRTE